MLNNFNNTNVDASILADLTATSKSAARIEGGMFRSDPEVCHINDFFVDYKCPQCGKVFSLMRADVPCYVYKLRQGRDVYCSYHCWLPHKKKVRMIFS